MGDLGAVGHLESLEVLEHEGVEEGRLSGTGWSHHSQKLTLLHMATHWKHLK